MLIWEKSLLVEAAGSAKGLNQKSLNVITITKKARVVAGEWAKVLERSAGSEST